MKSFKALVKNTFSVDWKNIKEDLLDESKRVYSIHDSNEDTILFI